MEKKKFKKKNGKRTVMSLFSGCVSSAVCKLVPSLASARTAEKFQHRPLERSESQSSGSKLIRSQPQGLTGIK